MADFNRKERSAVTETDVLSFIEAKGREVKQKDLTSVARANLLSLGRTKLFFEQLQAAVNKSFKNKIVPVGYAKKKPSRAKMPRVLNIMLSDLHFGSALDGKDSASPYGPKEESRRLAAIVKQVVEYKVEYRKDTELVVHLLGDIIENQLHDPRVGEPLAAQVCAAIHLLSQAVGIFASHFKKVTINCATGNHGRFMSRHRERAIFQKWDSVETVIYYAVKQAASGLKNVKVEIPKTPYYVANEFGMGVFGTHGDTVFRPGNPGKSINVESIEGQVTRLKATLGNHVKLFIAGHVHVPSMCYVGDGDVFITNGALVPANSFAVSLGTLKSVCGQTLWETVPGHIVGDYRFVTVDEKTDRDSTLDSIIQPFEDF